jgi:hypothetical protein
VRFRRKPQGEPDAADAVDAIDDGPEVDGPDGQPSEADALAGPYDSEDLPPAAEGERVDLGSLLIVPEPGRELRIQVDEATGNVQSVVIAGSDGALELRAFAAPRGGDLWSEARPQIASEVAQSGGTATEREGPWGTELICRVGPKGGNTQVTRVIGINGPRWMLRASLLGQPAVKPDEAGAWEESIRKIAVHRGAQAMPVGESLPVVMPPQARRVEQQGR